MGARSWWPRTELAVYPIEESNRASTVGARASESSECGTGRLSVRPQRACLRTLSEPLLEQRGHGVWVLDLEQIDALARVEECSKLGDLLRAAGDTIQSFLVAVAVWGQSAAALVSLVISAPRYSRQRAAMAGRNRWASAPCTGSCMSLRFADSSRMAVGSLSTVASSTPNAIPVLRGARTPSTFMTDVLAVQPVPPDEPGTQRVPPDDCQPVTRSFPLRPHSIPIPAPAARRSLSVSSREATAWNLLARDDENEAEFWRAEDG